MEITRQADYALRAVLDIARNNGHARVTTADIAARQGIPASFLAKIVGQLSVAGILSTSRGARGGVRLGRAADAITFLDVIEVIDGPIMVNRCVLDMDNCTFGASCTMRSVWCTVQENLTRQLRDVSVADMLQPATAPAA
ncbi:MAG: RrF2 family transcriptional regulator [Anaerolineales bacterium]